MNEYWMKNNLIMRFKDFYIYGSLSDEEYKLGFIKRNCRTWIFFSINNLNTEFSWEKAFYSHLFFFLKEKAIGFVKIIELCSIFNLLCNLEEILVFFLRKIIYASTSDSYRWSCWKCILFLFSNKRDKTPIWLNQKFSLCSVPSDVTFLYYTQNLYLLLNEPVYQIIAQ